VIIVARWVILFFVAILTWGTPVDRAQALWHGIPTVTCILGSAFVDGCSSAPTGSPQLSTILSGYAARPPWNVAGVDYHVGVPTNTVLSDPTIATLPSGCSFSSPTVTCSSGTPTLTALDFSLHNGTTLSVTGGSPTISNSKFVVGTNQGANGRIISITGTSSPTFINDEIDGANIAVTSQVGQTINSSNTGTNTFKYCYFHNSGGDMIDFNTGTRTNIIEYSVFKDIGVNTDHADTVQWTNSTDNNSILSFNLVYQSVNQGATGAGNGLFVIEDEGGGSINNMLLGNDTIIGLAACTRCNFITGYYEDTGSTGTYLTLHDLYIDPTAANNFTGIWMVPTGYFSDAFPSPTSVANVINMVTGTPYTTYPTGTSPAYFVVPDVNGYSPPLSDVYSTTPSPSSGNVTTGSSITFTLALNENWTISGGTTPFLALNSGGTATYTSGSGTSSIVFTYTVGSGDSSTGLAITSLNPNGSLIKDAVGNQLNFSTVPQTFGSITVNTGGGGSAPVVNSASPVASSTNAPAAQTSQAVATLTASNTPTGWSISGCSPSCTSWFAISSGGALTVTSTGASNIVPTDNGAVYTLTVAASNGAGTSAGKSIPVTFYADGALSAPTGTAPLPTLFSATYTIRPPWKVAGVDYPVGLPSGTTLSNPTTAGLPTGCTYSSSAHTVNCVTAGVTVSGYDFSVGNGVGLVIQAANIIVQNNNFKMGTNAAVPINVAASNPTIQYNTIDESGVEDVNTFGGVIYVSSGSATGMTIEYNYLKNACCDFVDSESGTTINKYNLATYDGETAGTHPDFNQFNPTSNNTTMQCAFNTWINTIPPSQVGSQGTTIGDNADPVVGTNSFDNNTLIASGSSQSASYWIRVYQPAVQAGATVSAQNNYADVTQAFGFAYPGSSGSSTTFANNTNLVTGGTFSNSP
jgi:hypothetical protein